MIKSLYRLLLGLYLLILIWLIILKLTFNISKIINLHHRSLNLIPFAAPSMIHGRINYNEMIFNFAFFIPFGLLLSVNFKQISFWNKLTSIMLFSISCELIQYVFAIGATDITDVITNTTGGLFGLLLYKLGNKYLKDEKLDRIIFFIGTFLVIIFLSMHFSHLLQRYKR